MVCHGGLWDSFDHSTTQLLHLLKHPLRISHSLNYLSAILPPRTSSNSVRFCSSFIHVLSKLSSTYGQKKGNLISTHYIQGLAVFSQGQVSVLSAWEFSDENTNVKKYEFFVKWDGQCLLC